MGARRNPTETQQSGHAQKSGPEVKNGRSIVPKVTRRRGSCGTIQKAVGWNLQMMSAGAARRILLPFYPA